MRNEPAEDFLSLLKEWAKLHEEFVLKASEKIDSNVDADENVKDEPEDIKDEAADDSSDSEEFEVEKLLAVCYGDPNSDNKPGVYFKVCFLQTCTLIWLVYITITIIGTYVVNIAYRLN